jgi:hypothetical protein
MWWIDVHKHRAGLTLVWTPWKRKNIQLIKWEYQKKGTTPLFGYLNYFLNIEFS